MYSIYVVPLSTGMRPGGSGKGFPLRRRSLVTVDAYDHLSGAQDLVANQAYLMFPEGDGTKPKDEEVPTPEQRAFVRATQGVHW